MREKNLWGHATVIPLWDLPLMNGIIIPGPQGKQVWTQLDLVKSVLGCFDKRHLGGKSGFKLMPSDRPGGGRELHAAGSGEVAGVPQRGRVPTGGGG